jgi:hypothetical protein
MLKNSVFPGGGVLHRTHAVCCAAHHPLQVVRTRDTHCGRKKALPLVQSWAGPTMGLWHAGLRPECGQCRRGCTRSALHLTRHLLLRMLGSAGVLPRAAPGTSLAAATQLHCLTVSRSLTQVAATSWTRRWTAISPLMTASMTLTSPLALSQRSSPRLTRCSSCAWCFPLHRTIATRCGCVWERAVATRCTCINHTCGRWRWRPRPSSSCERDLCTYVNTPRHRPVHMPPLASCTCTFARVDSRFGGRDAGDVSLLRGCLWRVPPSGHTPHDSGWRNSMHGQVPILR